MPYPALPSRRMGWDSDGTIFVTRDFTIQNAWTEIALDQREEINDEDGVDSTAFSGGGPDTYHSAWLFPEPREIDGVLLAWNGAGFNFSCVVATSADSTNGIDGSFTSQIGAYSFSSNVYNSARYRTDVTSLAVSGVRVLRATPSNGNGGRWRAAHIYGEITPGSTPDRLLFIDETTGLEFQLPALTGDYPRGSARDYGWRLKNNSTVIGNNVTLNTVQFTAESLFLTSGSWYTFSVGGDGFQATKMLPSLAPAATSALITTRQIIPAAAVLGPHAARIEATVGSLS